MFLVTTVNLSADTTSASAAHGSADLGDLPSEEFAALLERFRLLDSIQNHEADPHLLVTARAGRFVVRTGRGKLFLYDARDTVEPYAELTSGEIIQHLDRSADAAQADALDEASAKEPAPTPNRGIAFAILIAGLALNGYTLYSVFYTESVNEKPAITLVTDAAELAARQGDAVGTYATGDQPGDRVIAVAADGKMRFFRVADKSGLGENAETYHLGRHDKKYCLATTDSGVVDILNFDTLVYYRDTYKRTK